MSIWIVTGSSGEYDSTLEWNQSVWSDKTEAENEVIRLTRPEMVRREDKKNYPFSQWIFWGLEGPFELDVHVGAGIDEEGDRE